MNKCDIVLRVIRFFIKMSFFGQYDCETGSRLNAVWYVLNIF